MQLHTLHRVIPRKKRKRIGRGGKRGTYAGRGVKGQRARSGHRIRPAERDLIQRLPKLRGSTFKPRKEKAIAVKIGDAAARVAGARISVKTLHEAGLLRKQTARVKIVSDGEVTRALIIEGIPVSRAAREKITKAGGTIIEHS